MCFEMDLFLIYKVEREKSYMEQYCCFGNWMRMVVKLIEQYGKDLGTL